jgi:protein phosphatase
MEGINRFPYLKDFARKVASFKSVKGRELATNRVLGRGSLPNAAIRRIEEADQRAASTEVDAKRGGTERLRVGLAETVGRRATMEDVSIWRKEFPTPTGVLYGLFDGHGGREAAEYAALNLPLTLASRLSELSKWEDAYTLSFRQVQADMESWCMWVGTTAVLAIIEDTMLTVANVGDSRCVLFRDGNAVRLSMDHKPELPEEMAYIQSKGGFVKDGRTNGSLAVSRALGDGFLQKAANPTPHLNRINLTEQDSLLILACDGVWDVMSDQEACELVSGYIDPMDAAITLRDKAYELNSLDNISVIVVFLADLFGHTMAGDE